MQRRQRVAVVVIQVGCFLQIFGRDAVFVLDVAACAGDSGLNHWNGCRHANGRQARRPKDDDEKGSQSGLWPIAVRDTGLEILLFLRWLGKSYGTQVGKSLQLSVRFFICGDPNDSPSANKF